jgi:hypothetical protein
MKKSLVPIPAPLTMQAISDAIEMDRGATFRRHLRTLIPLAEDVFREEEDSFRSHLGASIIGRECPREIWYSFRWAIKPVFGARIIRLFNRGHLEEPRMVALLLTIGCKVWQYDENGKQFRIGGYKGHFGGGMDAVVLGVPDLPGEPMLGEFKTHNDKSFQKLKEQGVRASKFEHFVQMQTYMGKNSFRWGLYLATNKNDDDLHGELVEFDQQIYTRFQEQAAAIIDAKEPPPRINNSPGWYKCKFCTFREVCHEAAPPEKNCRTCKWAAPVEGAQWICQNPINIVDAEIQGWEEPITLTKESQLAACGYYEGI